MDTLVTISTILAVASVTECVLWVVLAIRAVREWRCALFVADALRLPAIPLPLLTVVIPAHNEEVMAAKCARSVLDSDYPALELVFVLDRCTDGTRATLEPIAAADSRLRIVDNSSCPADWAGKCNAARVGADNARGELILFTDADTHFDPKLLRASVQLLRARKLSMLSLFSAPTHNHWFEMVVQPVTSLMLLKLFPMKRANAPKGRRPFANGQFMLFDRAAYQALGGHAAVKDDLLEDLAFARRMKRAKMEQGVAVSDGMLVVSMYDSWKAFQTGWKRIYIESCRRNPERMRKEALQLLVIVVAMPIMRTASAVLAAIALLDGRVLDQGAHAFAVAVLCAGIAAPVIRLVTLAWIHRTASFPVWSALLFPGAALAVAGIFLDGARDLRARTPVRWGGRDYLLEPTNL
ncbi:MAG: glycosyltransferase [Planctomycetota bacterium]|nr:MAG: glycosyltransferase [Planctomycetota bacterium]